MLGRGSTGNAPAEHGSALQWGFTCNPNLRFKAPVRPGDTVQATVTVKELQAEKKRVLLTTVCTVGDKVVIDGEALVMPTSRQAA